VDKYILLHQRDAIGVQWHQFHLSSVPEGSAAKSFAQQVGCNAFVFLSNFHMDSLGELSFGFGSGRVGHRVGRGVGSSLETQGHGRSIREQAMMQVTFQELSEKWKISVFMHLEQPANHGDKGHLNRMGIKLIGQILYSEAWPGGIGCCHHIKDNGLNAINNTAEKRKEGEGMEETMAVGEMARRENSLCRGLHRLDYQGGRGAMKILQTTIN